jgi:hypothetical protein
LAAQADGGTLLRVYRNGQAHFVVISPDPPARSKLKLRQPILAEP